MMNITDLTTKYGFEKLKHTHHITYRRTISENLIMSIAIGDFIYSRPRNHTAKVYEAVEIMFQDAKGAPTYPSTLLGSQFKNHFDGQIFPYFPTEDLKTFLAMIATKN
jgi:hypothetical protein